MKCRKKALQVCDSRISLTHFFFGLHGNRKNQGSIRSHLLDTPVYRASILSRAWSAFSRMSVNLKYFFRGETNPNVSGRLHCRGFTNTLRHTTLGKTPLEVWSARRKYLYLTTHNTHKREASMPSAEFKPTLTQTERPQTHALDFAVLKRPLIKQRFGTITKLSFGAEIGTPSEGNTHQ
jgi:hypothetical protein